MRKDKRRKRISGKRKKYEKFRKGKDERIKKFEKGIYDNKYVDKRIINQNERRINNFFRRR